LYFWQVEQRAGSGVFTDLIHFAAGEISREDSNHFTPTEPYVGGIGVASLVGLELRVRAVYQDGNGTLEEVFSAPTAAVANVNNAPVGLPAISDTTPTETFGLTASTLGITDADGLTTAVFSLQWQQSALGGGAFTDLAGEINSNFTPTQDQVNRQLRVVVTYTDDHGTTETVSSAPTTVTGDLIPANAAAQTLTGTNGQDIIFGGAGADVINALGENDNITGGTGNDTINAGAGDDTINYTFGDGVDTIDGGTGNDTLSITGTGLNNTLAVVITGGVLTQVAGNSVTNVESATADMLGGTDILNYTGTTSGVSVDLGAGTATGFTSIAGIEQVVGGSGNDTLIGPQGWRTSSRVARATTFTVCTMRATSSWKLPALAPTKCGRRSPATRLLPPSRTSGSWA